MTKQKSDIRPSHPSHSAFNKRFEQQSPAHDVANDPWISQGTLPDVRQEFDMNRDPYVKVQLLDMQKSESERREETGRGSTMVGKDKPKLNLKPPQETGKQVDDQRFRDDWLQEQHAANLARAAPDQYQRHNDTREMSPPHIRTPNRPSR